MMLQYGRASYVLQTSVPAVYNNDWYIGCTSAPNGEQCDITVKFMERKV